VLSDQLVELLEKPELIPEILMKLLPFDLSIIRKQETELPESYFAEKLIPLSNNSIELENEWKKNFPIIELKELQCLGEYVQELRERYNFKRLPDSYFDLLEEKLPLQSLSLQSTEEWIRKLINILVDTKVEGKEYWLLLQEISKAYDSVHILMLVKAMNRLKILNRFINLIIFILMNRYNKVLTDLGRTELYNVEDRMDQ
ncbi:24994_t:CDS:2, partial [Gigaspora rosea]